MDIFILIFIDPICFLDLPSIYAEFLDDETIGQLDDTLFEEINAHDEDESRVSDHKKTGRKNDNDYSSKLSKIEEALLLLMQEHRNNNRPIDNTLDLNKFQFMESLVDKLLTNKMPALDEDKSEFTSRMTKLENLIEKLVSKEDSGDRRSSASSVM